MRPKRLVVHVLVSLPKSMFLAPELVHNSMGTKAVPLHTMRSHTRLAPDPVQSSYELPASATAAQVGVWAWAAVQGKKLRQQNNMANLTQFITYLGLHKKQHILIITHDKLTTY
jgi:hypothetical protein